MGNIFKKQKCIIPKCNRNVYYLEACLKHKCRTKTCLRVRYRDKYHCSRHCCFANNCKLEAQYHLGDRNAIVRLCPHHLCSYNGNINPICSNPNTTDTMYCKFHLCQVKNCYSPTEKHGVKYCANHSHIYKNIEDNNTPPPIITEYEYSYDENELGEKTEPILSKVTITC